MKRTVIILLCVVTVCCGAVVCGFNRPGKRDLRGMIPDALIDQMNDYGAYEPYWGKHCTVHFVDINGDTRISSFTLIGETDVSVIGIEDPKPLIVRKANLHKIHGD